MAAKRVYVRIVERVIGHSLPKGAHVHHVDQDRTNNRNDNLCVLQSAAEHFGLHQRLRILRAAGNPWTQQICIDCGTVKDLAEFSTAPRYQNGRSRQCRSCTAARAVIYYARKAGRPLRKLTVAEMSEKQRHAAHARWQPVEM